MFCMVLYVVLIRVAPDIRPAGYPAFYGIRYPAGYRVSFAGYRISGSSIDEIVDIVNNVNYIVLICKVEKI